jgi:hypothetical protein
MPKSNQKAFVKDKAIFIRRLADKTEAKIKKQQL